MFSNTNSNNSDESKKDFDNLNSTTCPPEDKMKNESRCSVNNINGTK